MKEQCLELADELAIERDVLAETGLDPYQMVRDWSPLRVYARFSPAIGPRCGYMLTTSLPRLAPACRRERSQHTSCSERTQRDQGGRFCDLDTKGSKTPPRLVWILVPLGLLSSRVIEGDFAVLAAGFAVCERTSERRQVAAPDGLGEAAA
eukprot:8950881-Pyramimonas_sp.AAC.1